MDTLVLDLVKLILNQLGATESILYGVDIGSNQEYIDTLGDLARFKIALLANNRYWINETISKIKDPIAIKWIVKHNYYEYYDLLIESIPNRFKNIRYFSYLYIDKRFDLLDKELHEYANIDSRNDEDGPYYAFYLCGRKGIVSILDEREYFGELDLEAESFYFHFVRGLSIGQHRELFEQYSPAINTGARIIMLLNFKDRDYVLQQYRLLDPNFEHISYLTSDITVISPELFRAHVGGDDDAYHNLKFLMLNRQFQYTRYMTCKLSERYAMDCILIGCLLSDINMISEVYNHFDDHNLLNEHLKRCCASDLILTTFNLKIEANKTLYELVQKLQPYFIDGYECLKYFSYHQDIHSTIMIVIKRLSNHYMDMCNAKAIRELYGIVSEYIDDEQCKLLVDAPIIGYSNNNHVVKKLVALKFSKLVSLARKLGIVFDQHTTKERLIIEIIKTKMLL